MNEKKWILYHGIHQGTLTSRDVAYPEKFDTRKDALRALEVRRKNYLRFNCVIWFAELESPDGKKEYLEGDSNYC